MIRVTLFGTMFDSNIGSISRVMSNMGATELFLVNPRCELTYTAQQSAASGQEALRNVKIFRSLDDYKKSIISELKFGFTCRDGKGRDVSSFEEILTEIFTKNKVRFDTDDSSDIASNFTIELCFGSEDCGLSNQELDDCHFLASLPVYGPNKSMNLSHAVMAGLLILRQNLNRFQVSIQPNLGENNSQRSSAPNEKTVFPDADLKRWVELTGFDISNRSSNAYKILKDVLLRAIPNENERRILTAVINQGSRKMKEYNDYRKHTGQSQGFLSSEKLD